jgi:hypothetical protein
MKRATVQYQIATYKGEVDVYCEPDDDNDVIIAKAKKTLTRQYGHLPYGYQSWKVISRED